MGMHQQRWDIAKIRRRHKAYRNLLLLELVMIWLIPFSQRFPLIIDLGAVALEVFFLNLVVHLSVLRSGRRVRASERVAGGAPRAVRPGERVRDRRRRAGGFGRVLRGRGGRGGKGRGRGRPGRFFLPA